ncbi:glycosyltransferase family 2 protein [Oleidesulfovibrio sp.]|uniref:glycosyltransferase family 2 protein n=1 Tax=Oleidesulfovibrio sp. TaxID=2909707 RepID=UPI003A873CC4
MFTQSTTSHRENASRRDVSILIPAYKPDWFTDCVESALAQTWPVKEVIISDDCPTNAIADAVRPYLADSRVRYVRNESPLGPCGNYLRLAQLCSTRWLKFLDDDDVLLPDGLEKLMAHTFGKTAVVTGACTLVHEDGSRSVMTPETPETVNGRRHFVQSSRRPPEGLFSRMLFRDDVVASVLETPLPPAMISLDEMLGFIAAFYGDAAYEHTPVCEYRLSESGYSRINAPQVLLDDMVCVTVPFSMAAERKFLLPKELEEWRINTLGQYTRRCIDKYIQLRDFTGMREFLRLMREEFGTLDTMRCAATLEMGRAFLKRLFR